MAVRSASVVDQYVQPAEFSDDRIDGILRPFMRADVCNNSQSAPAKSADVGCGLFQRRASAPSHGDIGAALCEEQCRRPADTGATARDEGNAAAKVKPFQHHHLLRR